MNEGDEEATVGGPTVSVCMPMARTARAVEASVRSVLAQDFGDFELLIGDETGAAAALVAEIGDSRVRYRHNPERLGFSQNHVALLDRARGRYLAVLHDDDRWEPAFLSRLVDVLEGDPEVGLACCAVVLDRGGAAGGAAGGPVDSTEMWPIPLRPGRSDGVLEVLLGEEWFMLQGNAVWRRAVWDGAARQWPDLCCGDLQFFLSMADAGWPVYFLDQALMRYSMHTGQSGAWRGADSGLGVAEDVLAFWERWLTGRSEREVELTARPRARWQLRRARALLLSGRRADARVAVAAAEALGGSDLPGLGRLRLAATLPNPVVRGAVSLKRAVDAVRSSGHR